MTRPRRRERPARDDQWRIITCRPRRAEIRAPFIAAPRRPPPFAGRGTPGSGERTLSANYPRRAADGLLHPTRGRQAFAVAGCGAAGPFSGAAEEAQDARADGRTVNRRLGTRARGVASRGGWGSEQTPVSRFSRQDIQLVYEFHDNMLMQKGCKQGVSLRMEMSSSGKLTSLDRGKCYN